MPDRPAHSRLDGLRRYVIEPAKVRIAAFVNISCIGLVAWDYELTHLDFCDVELFEMVANRHRDIVCGVKVRMGATTVGHERHRAGAARSRSRRTLRPADHGAHRGSAAGDRGVPAAAACRRHHHALLHRPADEAVRR